MELYISDAEKVTDYFGSFIALSIGFWNCENPSYSWWGCRIGVVSLNLNSDTMTGIWWLRSLKCFRWKNILLTCALLTIGFPWGYRAVEPWLRLHKWGSLNIYFFISLCSILYDTWQKPPKSVQNNLDCLSVLALTLGLLAHVVQVS